MKKTIAPPAIFGVPVTFNCPKCKRLIKRNLPFVDPSRMSKECRRFLVKYTCKCEAPSEIHYEVKKGQKIKLVDFISQEKSLLNKVKKTFKLAGI